MRTKRTPLYVGDPIGAGGGGIAGSGTGAAEHDLVGDRHTGAGLTAGHFLKALSPTTFGFAAHGLVYSDVGAAAAGHNHSGLYSPVGHDHSGVYDPAGTGHAEAAAHVSAHAALITGVHGLVFTAGKTLTLTESLTLNALPIGGLAVATGGNVLGSLAVGATTQYLAGGGAGTVPAWQTLNQAAIAGLRTSDSPVFVTVKLSSLTAGYVPYNTAGGLANSPIYTDGTNVRIGTSSLGYPFEVNNGVYHTFLHPNTSTKYFGVLSDSGLYGFSQLYDGELKYYRHENSVAGAAYMTVLRSSGAVLLGATSAVGSEIFRVDGDVYFDHSGQIGGNFNPVTVYTSNLGTLQKKYLTLHAAELWVETLVAQNTMATIGGRILVGPTTVLARDAAPGDTTIYVKHNSFLLHVVGVEHGSKLILEAAGKFEIMYVTTTTTPSAEEDGSFAYVVSRDSDGSGANQWYAGDAVFDTGKTGSGFIDLYSVHGVNAASQYGPTIVGNVRLSGTVTDWAPRWAVGNLNGLYGYSADTYGAAFGSPSAAWIKIDPTNGVRIGHNTTVFAQITAAGAASFTGSVTITGGSGYGNLTDKPTLGSLAAKNSVDLSTGEVTNKSLANVDSTANTKLSGIAAGATVGATWGTNLSSIPAMLGTPSGSGLFLSSTHMGYYTGGAFTTYIQSNGNWYFAGDASNYVSWNGSVLAVKGAITANTGYIGGTGGWVIDTSLIKATNARIYSDGTEGYVSFGTTPPTSYGNNAGVWLGSSAVAGGKFSLYKDASNFLQWDGSNLAIKSPFVTISSTGIVVYPSTVLGYAVANGYSFTSFNSSEMGMFALRNTFQRLYINSQLAAGDSFDISGVSISAIAGTKSSGIFMDANKNTGITSMSFSQTAGNFTFTNDSTYNIILEPGASNKYFGILSASGLYGFSQLYDGDLKYYRHENSAAGAIYMTVLRASGNVGIGTESPADKLEVAASGNTTIRITTTATNDNEPGLELWNNYNHANARNWRIATDVAAIGDFAIRSSDAAGGDPRSAGTTHFSIYNGVAKFGSHVAGTNVRVNIDGVASKAALISFQQSGADKWLIGNGPASEDNKFAIYNAVTGVHPVIIDPTTSNVGIKMAPSYTLDVTGDLRVSGGFGCNGHTPQGSAYPGGTADGSLASVTNLCNGIRDALINCGIC
jgi:hypothetical protein